MIRTTNQLAPLVKVALYLFIAGMLLVFMYVARFVLIPLFFAALISILLNPVCNFLERNRIPRILSIVLAMLMITLVVLGLVYAFSSQFYGFIKELPSIADKVTHFLNYVQWTLYKNFNIKVDTNSGIFQNTISKFLDSGVLLLQGTISTFIALINFFALIPIYVFLMLLYREAFMDFLIVVTPMEKHRTARHIIAQIQKVVYNYLYGIATVMLIVGSLDTIALLIIGVDYAFFFAFFAAFLMIIPYLGLFIGSLFPAIYMLLTKDSTIYPLAILLSMGFVQFLEGNFITPRITGNRVSVNALAAILALVIGGYLWGLAGLILFMPLVAIIKVVCDHFAPLKPYGVLLGSELSSKKNLFTHGTHKRLIRFNLRKEPLSPPKHK